jgi:gas vesicle protein
MATRLSSWISGFLIGGAIGVGAALLSAPQSGEMTRFMLREKGKQVKGQALSTYEDTRNQAQQVIGDVTEQVKTRASRLSAVGQDVLEEQKHVLERGASRVKRAIKEEGQQFANEQRDVMDHAASATDEAING